MMLHILIPTFTPAQIEVTFGKLRSPRRWPAKFHLKTLAYPRASQRVTMPELRPQNCQKDNPTVCHGSASTVQSHHVFRVGWDRTSVMSAWHSKKIVYVHGHSVMRNISQPTYSFTMHRGKHWSCPVEMVASFVHCLETATSSGTTLKILGMSNVRQMKRIPKIPKIAQAKQILIAQIK